MAPPMQAEQGVLTFCSFAVKNAVKLFDEILDGKQPSLHDVESGKQLLLTSYEGQDMHEKMAKQMQAYDPDTRAALMQISLGKNPLEMPRLPVRMGNTPSEVIPRQMRTLLVNATIKWNFDPFHLHKASAGKPLSGLFLWLMHESGLTDRLGLNPSKLRRFATEVEAGYGDHAYHNRIHVCAVLQRVHIMLLEGGVGAAMKDQTGLLTFAAYLAAICHDFRHKGVTNDFLVRSGDSLALYYNDQAPHENYHLTQTFALLNNEYCNVLSDLPPDARQYVRQIVISMVLATDMSRHVHHQEVFSARMVLPSPWENNEAKMIALNMMIKCADLSHTATNWNEHRMWVTSLQEEFWCQGDKERTLGLPISPLTDRRKQGLTNSQIGFFEIFVIPMYKHMVEAFPDCQLLLDGAQSNCDNWKQVES